MQPRPATFRPDPPASPAFPIPPDRFRPAAGPDSLRLRDGRSLHLRSLTPADGEAQLRFFTALSERSRRLRFAAPMPRVSASRLRPLLAPDGVRHRAWGAFDGRELVAVARWIVADPSSPEAEVSLAVADGHQGLGLGRGLVRELAAAARSAGLLRLRFAVAGENLGMQRLLRSLGVVLRYRDGLGEGVLEVDRARAA